MNNNINLFFELIQVSLGTRICLSHTPTADEWCELYSMAKKHSLVGVCFAGVQRLQVQHQIPSEMQYLTWLGMAAKIQQRNEAVNKQCAELTSKFRKDGFDAVVLKGQSCARRYGALSGLRQSGDIDVWVSGSRDEIKNYITKNYHVGEVIYNHAHVGVFQDTEVEVHFTPSWLYNPFRNRRLQEWFKEFLLRQAQQSERFRFQGKDMDSTDSPCSFKSPSVEFDLVYLMLHAYRHMLHEGLGLRQVMDYYMMLCTDSHSTSLGELQCSRYQAFVVLKQLGVMKFASAMMYVMKVVFDLDESDMICVVDERRGKRLLEEIMRGGNMGRGDDRTGKSKTRVGYFWVHVSRQWSFMRDYPSEVLWSPMWKAWHFMMRKIGKI